MLSEEYKTIVHEEAYKNYRLYRCLIDRLQAQSIPVAMASKIVHGCLSPSYINEDARVYYATEALNYLLSERWHVVSLSFTTYEDVIAYILAWQHDYALVRCFAVMRPTDDVPINLNPVAPCIYVKEIRS